MLTLSPSHSSPDSERESRTGTLMQCVADSSCVPIVIVSSLFFCSTKPKDGVYIHDPENGSNDSNVALEKLRDVIAQCILPQAGKGCHF